MLALITLYSVLWIFFHFGAGYVAHRLPLRLLCGLPVVGRSYAWERNGRIYWQIGIRSWKDRLPEAGAFYRGGYSKRHLHGNDAQALGEFARETCRAEFSHWLTWATALTFFAWNPWPIGVAMLVYGAAVNVPCILIQRYNRIRLHRAVQTLVRRAHRN